MKNRCFCVVIFAGLLFVFSFTQKPHSYKHHLSEYGFFAGNLSALQPAENTYAYQLNTPLFSDYAHKARFIYLPQGAAMGYNAHESFDFPQGTILIKTFYYPNDFRQPNGKRRILETRLLLHETEGWTALTYIWNEAQTEATLDLAGDSKAVQWKDDNGKMQKLNYAIPNANECKGCHSASEKIVPLGTSARQLHRNNQLSYWASLGILTALPSDTTLIPRLAVWNDPSTGTLAQRARAWLDINCASCHSETGSANTSGLLLSIYETNSTALGILKTPVAAGRGSGGRLYDITPKKPDESILIYRLESVDPGIRMPEIGRQMVPKEAVALLKEWIRGM